MDGVIDFLENLTSRLHQDFDELIGKDTNKKRFVKVLTRIFALLLNTKVDTADKIKRILRIFIESTLKICQEPKWLLVEWSARSRPRRYLKIEGAKGSSEPTPTRLNWPCLNRRQWTSRKMEKSSRPYVSDVFQWQERQSILTRSAIVRFLLEKIDFLYLKNNTFIITLILSLSTSKIPLASIY